MSVQNCLSNHCSLVTSQAQQYANLGHAPNSCRHTKPSELLQSPSHKTTTSMQWWTRRSRFGALQGALFAASSASSSDGVPTVARQRVLRRHLAGPPAFVLGALGNVGLAVPQEDESVLPFVQAAAEQALAFYHSSDDAQDVPRHRNIWEHRDTTALPPVETLQWTGDWRRSRDGGVHVRYQQYFDDRPVQGGNLLVHADAFGNIVAMNGEYVNCRPVLSRKTLSSLLSPEDAMSVALQSLVNNVDKDVMFQTPPDLSLVVTDDLSCCLAYQSTVTYYESNQRERKQDIVYADARHGTLCARDPLIRGQTTAHHQQHHHHEGSKMSPHATSMSSWPRKRERLLSRRIDGIFMQRYNDHVAGNTATTKDTEDGNPKASISTYFCTPSSDETTDKSPQSGDCKLVSTSPSPITTGNAAIDCAHNYALATFRYFWRFHGLHSLDGKGYEIISYVLSDEFDVANGACWKVNARCRVVLFLIPVFVLFWKHQPIGMVRIYASEGLCRQNQIQVSQQLLTCILFFRRIPNDIWGW